MATALKPNGAVVQVDAQPVRVYTDKYAQMYRIIEDAALLEAAGHSVAIRFERDPGIPGNTITAIALAIVHHEQPTRPEIVP